MKCKYCERNFKPPKYASSEENVCFTCTVNKNYIKVMIQGLLDSSNGSSLSAEQSTEYWANRLNTLII